MGRVRFKISRSSTEVGLLTELECELLFHHACSCLEALGVPQGF